MMAGTRFDILTLFPEMFPAVLEASMLGRAADADVASYHVTDVRDFATDRHRKVDDRPFGGGPGMVMMCEPLFEAVRAVEARDERPATRVLLTPQGEPLRQPRVEDLATQPRLLLIAGHYEGIDERLIDELDPIQISVGDFVTTGGELPALLLLDSIVRLLPGVLGHEDSAALDSFTLRDETGDPLLDCPHYTRPREWRGRAVPDVLLSGDHQAIERWRRQQMVDRTRDRRPDLFSGPADNQNPPPPPAGGPGSSASPHFPEINQAQRSLHARLA